jgi:hypothetical protein
VSAPATWKLPSSRVDRVDRPAPGLFAVSLASREGRAVALLACGPPRKRPAFEVVTERPRGDGADASVRGLREKLEGGVVTRAWSIGGALGLEIVRGDATWWVEGGARGLSCLPAIEGTLPEGDTVVDVPVGALEPFVREHAHRLAEGSRVAARAALRKVATRLERRIVAVEGDLAAGAAADAKATHAAVFVAAAAHAASGATELVAEDWSTGTSEIVRFPLDPARSPRAQLDAVFAAAKRRRGGVKAARARIDEAFTALAKIEEAQADLDACDTAEDVDRRMLALTRVLPPGVAAEIGPRGTPTKTRARPDARLPYRRYTSASGAAILVGRSARDNDELTVRVARPGDLWLHVRDRSGSHVVAPAWFREGRLDPDTLLDAATLAAHFSDERGERLVEVAYTDRRHVRKRKGSPPGQVEIANEKVLPLRFDDARLVRLLATADVP